ncbi:MAG TPA: protoglobin family protein [Planctomycetota bacterium]|nr:protoglobin family protein [Planctomycetota bacterium]
MKTIDERRLETDLGYRFQYLAEFIGFGEEDILAVTRAAKHLAPLVPTLVDAVYDKLFSYDATKRHFMPKQSGYEGEVPTSLADLSHNHPMIKFRKDKLSRYLVKLVSGPYDTGMVNYLDMVGKIHTSKAGAKNIVIPLVQMNALMGFVSTALAATLLSLEVPAAEKNKMLLAFNKLLWIQNDLITRHYQDEAMLAAAQGHA